MAARRTCPSCGAARAVPIVYGYPVPVTMVGAELGLLLTWGCLVGDDLPRWSCPACGHRWGRLDDAQGPAWHGAIGWAMKRARAALSAV